MKILLTGSAGFIGFHTFLRLREAGHEVVGLDNINDYYDVRLKLGRLRQSGFETDEIVTGKKVESRDGGYFCKIHLEDRDALQKIFAEEKFDAVCHLAAQPGVRYSLQNPYAYIDSNIVAFLNILENCRHHEIGHLVYASSSSVYGDSSKVPFSVDDRVDQPVSLYAATKISNELMAHCYSHLFHFAVTGLRFFTVYGPWGRMDMAMFKFTKSILEGKPIEVYNHGDLSRDFTYIDDIVNGIGLVLEKTPEPGSCRIYNIGHGSPVRLLDFIHAIERATGRKAILEMKEMQLGDVNTTWADTASLERDFDYRPKVAIEEGVSKFVAWYRDFYHC